MNHESIFARRPVDYWVLWGLALALLLLNTALILLLFYVRAQAARTTAQAAGVVAEIGAASIDTTLIVEDEIDVDGSVPLVTTVQVPIQATIPVNTTVSIPIQIPLVGTRTIQIPIQTSIPVDLTVDVPVNTEIPVRLTVPVNIEVPVKVDFSQTEFGAALNEAETLLRDLTVKLGGE